jgi:hypothetical protein
MKTTTRAGHRIVVDDGDWYDNFDHEDDDGSCYDEDNHDDDRRKGGGSGGAENRAWRKLRRLCCRGADGGRGWIDAGRPQRWAHNNDTLRAWIDAGPLSSSYVALLGRESP